MRFCVLRFPRRGFSFQFHLWVVCFYGGFFMNTIGIHLAWIVVKDFNAAIHFYTEVVGLTLKEKVEEYGWAELSGPSGTILAIMKDSPESEFPAGSNAVVTITVKDLQIAREHFMKKGAKLLGDIVEVPGHVRLQSFVDADGNRMQLVQEL